MTQPESDDQGSGNGRGLRIRDYLDELSVAVVRRKRRYDRWRRRRRIRRKRVVRQWKRELVSWAYTTIKILIVLGAIYAATVYFPDVDALVTQILDQPGLTELLT